MRADVGAQPRRTTRSVVREGPPRRANGAPKVTPSAEATVGRRSCLRCRYVGPMRSNLLLGHLWQVVRYRVPRRLELDIDVFVRFDEGIIIECASWYLEPGLASF